MYNNKNETVFAFFWTYAIITQCFVNGVIMESNKRLIFKHEVLDRTAKSYPTIWRWMRSGQFPRSVVVGGQVAWFADELDEWFDQLPRRRLLGDADPST